MTEQREIDLAAIDMADAAMEYFHLDGLGWSEEQKEAAGKYLLKQAALRL